MTLSKNTRTRLIHRGGKRVRAHRWLMEQHLGRNLLQSEHIHHKNGNPLDNRLDNLEVKSAREHMVLHKQKYPDKKICEVCGSEYFCNPRKRRRQKTCSQKCAYILRRRNYGKSSRSARKCSASLSSRSKRQGGARPGRGSEP